MAKRKKSSRSSAISTRHSNDADKGSTRTPTQWAYASDDEIEQWRADRERRLDASDAWREVQERLGPEQWGINRTRDVILALTEFVAFGPVTIVHLPLLEDQIDLTPRSLDAFAKRAERLYREARDELGIIRPEVAELAELARDIAQRKRGPRNKAGSGRRLQPETDMLEKLDVMLEAIPSTARRELMAGILRDVAGADVGSGDQIRHRLKDYRRRQGR